MLEQHSFFDDIFCRINVFALRVCSERQVQLSDDATQKRAVLFARTAEIVLLSWSVDGWVCSGTLVGAVKWVCSGTLVGADEWDHSGALAGADK